jgi:hypothetical protein
MLNCHCFSEDKPIFKYLLFIILLGFSRTYAVFPSFITVIAIFRYFVILLLIMQLYRNLCSVTFNEHFVFPVIPVFALNFRETG